MGEVRFSKMHGAGNDFVMLDLRDGSLEPDRTLTELLGDRHKGVGADQIISIELPRDPATVARYRIWNADGSTSQQCGNGARCVAAWVERALGYLGEFKLESPAGIHSVTSLGDGDYRIEMGVPEFVPSAIPLHGFNDAAVTYDAQGVTFSAVSMGNPHAVVVVDDVSRADVDGIGRRLQTSPQFPESVNVGFAQVIDRAHAKLRVFERGVGETLACGSGACAAAVSLMRLGLVDRTVAMELPGGVLTIDWPTDDASVAMTGPTAFVFEGVLDD